MTSYDPTPIALTPGNISLLEPVAAALATNDLYVAVDADACARYLVDRVNMPAELAARVIDALTRLAATA
jgi:hypothetical protein